MQTANVYVAGSTQDANNVSQATYWKNTTPVVLTNASAATGATGITLFGSDVYVSGYVTAANGNYVATYWKNGLAVSLSSSNVNSIANQLIVQGNDVYVGGFAGTSAVYWKNGVQITLSPTIYGTITSASGIVLRGSDILISGYAVTNSGPIAVYWKNGTPTVLPDSLGVYAGKITIQGDDVYITATRPSFDPNKTDVSYWKNGIAVGLANGTTGINITSGIAFDGSDTYVAGNIATSQYPFYTGAYWRNGLMTLLTSSKTYPTTSCMALYGGDVYIGSDSVSSPTFWKNGIEVSLPTPTTNGGSVTAIAVTSL